MCDLEMTILDRPKATHLGCHGTTIALLTESTTLFLAQIHSHSETPSCVASVSLIFIFNLCVLSLRSNACWRVVIELDLDMGG